MHVQTINEAVKSLPEDRITGNYCYGNYSESHLTDPDYSSVLPELLKLKVGTLVGKMTNTRHAGGPTIIKSYVKEYGCPKSLKFATGVIDVKIPFLGSLGDC